MSDGDDVLKEVHRRLDRVLTCDSRPDYKQLMKCLQPAFERYNDLVSDNKRLSAMQHFVLSDLSDMKAKEQQLEKELLQRKMVPKVDVAIQEPERTAGSSDEESSSEEEKPHVRTLRRPTRKEIASFKELEFVTGITDAALLNFDPRSRPIPTPWRQRRGPKAFFTQNKMSKVKKVTKNHSVNDSCNNSLPSEHLNHTL